MNLPARRQLPANVNRSVSGELVNADLVNQVYEQLGLDELFDKYASHTGDAYLDEDIHAALTELAIALTSMAYTGNHIEVDLIREGFDRVYAGMNLAAGKAHGIEIRKGVISSLLIKAGIRQQEYRGAVLPLDDKYWQQQFMEQFHSEGQISRVPDEPEEVYLARYIQKCLLGFPWAYFTHAV